MSVTTVTADIRTDAADVTARRLSLLGIPADVAEGLVAYLGALNAARLTLARTEYPHMLRGYYDATPGTERDSIRDAATVTSLTEWSDVDPSATGAGKYLQVVDVRPDHASGELVAGSVHSVVVKATGQVCKSAGWKQGPAKSTAKATRGRVLSHYTLTDADSLAALVAELERNPHGIHGGYLYTR